MRTYGHCPVGSASSNHSVNKSSTNVSHLGRTESSSALSVLLYVTGQKAFHSSLCAYQLSLFSFSLGAIAPSGPWPPHSREFLWFLDHTQWHTTVGRTPLDE